MVMSDRETAENFVKRLDDGALWADLNETISKLTHEQLEEVSRILLDRETKRQQD